jgi:hypothetical protein
VFCDVRELPFLLDKHLGNQFVTVSHPQLRSSNLTASAGLKDSQGNMMNRVLSSCRDVPTVRHPADGLVLPEPPFRHGCERKDRRTIEMKMAIELASFLPRYSEDNPRR